MEGGRLRYCKARPQGRVAHVARLNPQRGERLKRIFDQIAW